MSPNSIRNCWSVCIDHSQTDRYRMHKGMLMKKTVQVTLWLAAAVLLSACGDDDRRNAVVDVGSIGQVARIVAQKQDRVAVDDLARWIIEGRKDFVLIDIRSADDFAAGHIDRAQNIPLTELVSAQRRQALPNDRKLVLYSQGSELAAQAAVLLRLSGYDANLLLGGYNFWSQHVLNPDIHPTGPTGSTRGFRSSRPLPVTSWEVTP
ncbi:MAG TPA: rhodanese-like domain-containing protein [Gammaproteobacteria bacterium]|nr:rhodanese-like domain-containing protein [Gammaproteobacteria bacterium]